MTPCRAAVVSRLCTAALAAQSPRNRRISRTRSRSTRRCAPATLPNGLNTSSARTAGPPSGSRCGSRSRPARSNEADDQQGLAHLIEHMAFNGSAHFKPGELVSYFESIGARLGPHVNAYTSFDETVYMLDLPTDKPEIVAKGLTALADFAGGLTLDPGRGRQGARRRHRGVARRPRRRLAHPRQADAGAVPRFALRGAAADRQAGDHPHRAGRRGCARSTTPGTGRSGWR